MGENRNARDTNVKGRTECIRYLHNNRLQEKTEDARNTNYQSIQEKTVNAQDINVTINYGREQRLREILT